MMMRDQFANYVVQKMLDVVDGEQRELLLSRMKPHLSSLKKFTYGKHILTKVERLLGYPIPDSAGTGGSTDRVASQRIPPPRKTTGPDTQPPSMARSR